MIQKNVPFPVKVVLLKINVPNVKLRIEIQQICVFANQLKAVIPLMEVMSVKVIFFFIIIFSVHRSQLSRVLLS